MDVKLDAYRTFYYVSKNKSFSKAAEELYMTQSAISQAIKNLEQSLDSTLFIRTSKGVSLTSEGEVLFKYVRDALSFINTGEQQIQKLKKIEFGDLKIGVGDTFAKYILLPYLDKFHQIYPNIKFQILNRTSIETVQLLKEHKVDLAFINLPLNDNTITTRKHLEVHDVFVAGSKFHHLKDKVITMNELNKLPLIVLDSSSSRNYVEQYFHQKGYSLIPEIELGSHDLLLEFAKINLGIACVTKEFAQSYLDSGELFELQLKSPIPKRNIGVCSLKNVSNSHVADAFLKLMVEQIEVST